MDILVAKVKGEAMGKPHRADLLVKIIKGGCDYAIKHNSKIIEKLQNFDTQGGIRPHQLKEQILFVVG
jgi:hypothetical protein